MKVAVVYNEAYPELTDEYQTKLPEDLDFTPYFDLEGNDPIAEYEAIAQAIRGGKYEAYIVNIMDDFNKFLRDYKKNKPDVVFNLVEIYKDIAKLEMGFAGILDLLRIPYTGAPPLALGTCQNKTLTKRILGTVGVRTPRYKYIKKERKTYRLGLKYPLIVKPALEDASVGIENESIVTNHKSLKERIELILYEYEQPALVEEFINGRELNVAVFGDKNPVVLPISEIDFTEMPNELYNIVSYQAKWEPMHEAYHKTIPICPAKLPKRIEKEAGEIALNCFKIMGCRDYCRVDMRLSEDKKLYVLEVNPNPDLTEDAGFMRSANYAGYTYKKTLRKIVDFAYARKSIM